jgi:hypothetical protein
MARAAILGRHRANVVHGHIAENTLASTHSSGFKQVVEVFDTMKEAIRCGPELLHLRAKYPIFYVAWGPPRMADERDPSFFEARQ